MSWQAYVDTNLVGTGKIAKAAILGLQGGVWAFSPGFTISTDEQKKVVDAYKNLEGVRTSGLVVAGIKYFTLSADGRSIYLKKGANGVVIVKTTQAVLVALYEAPCQAPEATPVVEGLADYLIAAKY
ncbi:profilin [Infundibulicybe gibba]|nr:profilin [Infundibulicybe gibba]